MTNGQSEPSSGRWRFAGPATGGQAELKGPVAERLDFAIATAMAAGRSIVAGRGSQPVSYRYKSGHELVSTVDESADALIRGAIGRLFPTDAILSEETADSRDVEFTCDRLWIVDPIDGTVNFVHGLDAVAVSIAYAEQGIVRAGVVHAPFLNDTYCALLGDGAWRNGSRIRVSNRRELKEALIGTGFPHDRRELGQLLRKLEAVLTECRGVRRMGSPALDICMVAEGRLDGYYETVFPWDVAAASLIAREAGAAFGHLEPVPGDTTPDLCGADVVVAAPTIVAELIALLKAVG